MSTTPGSPAPIGPAASTDLDSDLPWVRVSPSLVVARHLALLWNLVPLVALVVAAVLLPGPWWWLAPAAWLVLSGAGWVVVGRGARAIGYLEREDDLMVRHGLLFRTVVVVPYGRLQYVDVTAGPLERALGISTVQLHTAAAATDATIPGLPPHEAARLREALAARGRARLAGL